jgi:hypothetical protein
VAVMVVMRWAGTTLDQYEETKKVVDWENVPPAGGIVHATAHDGTSLRITDIWESADDFNAFVNDRLMPGVAQVGIAGQPDVEIFQLHDLITTGVPGAEGYKL